MKGLGSFIAKAAARPIVHRVAARIAEVRVPIFQLRSANREPQITPMRRRVTYVHCEEGTGLTNGTWGRVHVYNLWSVRAIKSHVDLVHLVDRVSTSGFLPPQ